MGLMLHCGAEPVTREALKIEKLMKPTPKSATHEVLPHADLLKLIEESLQALGTFEVVHEELGLTKDGERMFGVLGLRGPHSAGDYEILYGFRNSNDMRFSASAGIGSRVFICDNLAMATEHQISHKHCPNIYDQLRRKLSEQVSLIEDQGKELEARYDHLKGWVVDQPEADHIIMNAVRAGACPNAYIPEIDSEWRKPRHSDFNDRTAWSLFNAFTQVNQDKKLNFEHQIPRTKILHQVFDGHTEFKWNSAQSELPLAA